MAPTPVVYRIQELTPGTVTESSSLFATQLEEIPYPWGETEEATDVAGVNRLPAGFRELDMSTTTEDINSLSLLPTAFDLSWIQGDTAVFQFLFTDVIWTIDDPGVDEPFYDNTAAIVTNAVLSTGIAGITTQAAHGFLVGYSVTISDVGGPYDGTFTVLSVPTPTTFTYALAGANIATAAVSGEAVITNLPVWHATEWAAQVRNPYIISTFAADYWVPANGYQYNWWRGHSVVAEFNAVAEVVTVPDIEPVQWATMVTLTLPADRSMNILPGNWYRWDLQSRTIENEVRTHLRGRVNVVTEWTVR